MQIHVHPDKQATGLAAAKDAADCLRRCLKQRGRANLIVAPGASQFDLLSALIATPGVQWVLVTVFHRKLPILLRQMNYLDAEEVLASTNRQHADSKLYLDTTAASGLPREANVA